MDIEEEVATLKARLERLETTVHQMMHGESTMDVLGVAEPLDHAQLRAWLTAQGVISNPSPSEIEAAAQWRALPEDERHGLRAELDRLPPGPMVSDIVSDQRG